MKIVQIGTINSLSGFLALADPSFLCEGFLPVPPENPTGSEEDPLVVRVKEVSSAREYFCLAKKDLEKEDLTPDNREDLCAISLPMPGVGVLSPEGDPGLGVLLQGFGGSGIYPVYAVTDKNDATLVRACFIDFGGDAFRVEIPQTLIDFSK